MSLRLWVAAASLTTLAASNAWAGKARHYAIVVAQNRSLDRGVPPLRYADDDGIKTFELLSLYAERASLFVVADEETTRLHPETVRSAEVPEREAIFARLRQYNREMAEDVARGDEPELFFVYAGHGDVDENGQGYVNLHDGKLTRSDLFREVIAPSKARFVHVIIDACKSYFMVNSRGGKQWRDDRADPATDRRSDAQLRAFLSAEKAEEQLENYPRAGVIVATSGDGETHEWERYQAGILSHELRSGLAGAADVNGDGRIEYSELRAFLAAANARVRNPEARVQVFSRAPTLDRHHAIVDLRGAQTRAAKFLHFAQGLSGRFHIEDDRGVRLVDLHKEPAGTFDVVVGAARGYFVRRASTGREGSGDPGDETEEVEVRPQGSRRVELAQLSWRQRPVAARGAIEASFRQDLYKVPFGRSFYDGYVATSGDLPVEDGAPFVVRDLERPSGPHRLSVGYLLSSSPAGDTGFNHGVDLRYGYRVWRFLDLGAAAQVGYGSSTNVAGEQHLTRFSLMATLGAEWLPLAWLALRAETAVGWQLFSGALALGGMRVDGAEGRGLRFELGGGLGFRVTHPLWLFVRGGLAVDGVFPQIAPGGATPNGYFAAQLQVRL